MAMERKGFSLIELIIVMSLLAILASIVTINFNSWQRKYNIEAQVREMLSDFSDVRVRAIQTKTKQRVVLNPTSYSFTPYSTETALSARVVFTKNLKYPIQQLTTSGLTAFNNTALEIDERGYTTNWMSIAVAAGMNEPSLNCLTVSWARVNMGRVNGNTCEFQ